MFFYFGKTLLTHGFCLDNSVFDKLANLNVIFGECLTFSYLRKKMILSTESGYISELKTSV